MARNSSGTMTRVSNSFSNPVSGTAIDPTNADALFDDYDTEITDSLSRTGKGGMSANLSMGGFSITSASAISVTSLIVRGGTAGQTTVVASASASGNVTIPPKTTRLVGRDTTDTLTNKTFNTKGTGNVFQLDGVQITSATDILDRIGTIHGSILYRNDDQWVALEPGTNGQVLTSGGASANPSFTTVAGTGDVVGTASSTDMEIVIFRGTGGKNIGKSLIVVDASANCNLPSGGQYKENSVVISPVGKHTIWVPASAMLSATTSGPASAQVETITNDINMKVLDFDASADEHAHFNIAMPKSWNESTITFQVWWMSSAIDTDGVAWGLQAVAVSDNEAADASWGTPVVVTDDAQGAANEVYVTSESSAVTVGGTPAESDIVFFRIFRDVSDANDDMTEDARLIGVKIFLTTSASTDA